MQETTTKFKEHLDKAFEELKAAQQKTDAEMRARINSAVTYAESARADLKSRIDSGNVKLKEQAETTRSYLNEFAENSKKALGEKGDALHTRLIAMTENMKHALDSARHFN